MYKLDLSASAGRDPNAPVYVTGGKVEFLTDMRKLRQGVVRAKELCAQDGLSLLEAWHRIRAE